MYILDNHVLLRLGTFIGLLVVLGLIERILPQRQVQSSLIKRWSMHSALLVSATFLSRVVLPVTLIEFAFFCADRQLGVFHYMELPTWISFLLSLVVLDLAIYAQHLLFHKWPLLWRLHKVHHSDKEMDVSTAIRFHPLEILLSSCFKLLLIFLLGAPALSILIFELLLNAGALFSHSNIKFSPRVDKYLRCFIVTPRMHCIHHSIYPEETNSNYGFFLSLWDRLFNTYTNSPRDGYNDMTIGLDSHLKSETTGFVWAILLPFKKSS